jgi:hypothetical protein
MESTRGSVAKENGRRVAPAAATISSSFVRTEFYASSAALRTKPFGRSQPPFCGLLEWVELCEPSADFDFAPGHADAALLAKTNAIAAAILK